MVVIRRHIRRCLAAAGAVLLLPGAAYSDTPGALSDAWLRGLAQQQEAAVWSHAVVARQETRERMPHHQRRLVAELDTLVASARLAGAGQLGQGLAEWRAQVAQAGQDTLRTPGRHDLPWIAADLRRDLPLSQVAHFGLCTPPSWVEVWHHRGITRVDWQPAMTLRDAVERLPQAAWASANQAVVITPTGKRLSRGVATWNRETAALAPGSRIMLALPEAQGLRTALPFPGTVEEASWVNRELPEFLATRLPADQCTLWKP